MSLIIAFFTILLSITGISFVIFIPLALILLMGSNSFDHKYAEKIYLEKILKKSKEETNLFIEGIESCQPTKKESCY